jgi:hypothetical protein
MQHRIGEGSQQQVSIERVEDARKGDPVVLMKLTVVQPMTREEFREQYRVGDYSERKANVHRKGAQKVA